jgi:hypothetical protein
MNIRILSLLTSICLIGSASFAAESSFVGKWKLNPNKGKFTGLREKIENVGGDKYQFTFGDDVESVTFDGKDHPAKYGGTWSVTKTGSNTWKSVRKHNGKVSSTATWTLSKDGKRFTSATDGTRPDGSKYHNVFEAKRVAGTSGLAGTWESTKMQMSSPAAMEIATSQSGGWSIMFPAEKERTDLKFDGKDYPDKGPRVAKGTTMSGQRTNDRTVEFTGKVKGKTVYTEQMKLSKDGKTLTATLHFPGVAKPEVDVYERE